MYNYKSTNIHTCRAYTLFLEGFPSLSSFSHPRWSSLGVSWLSISSCSWCSSLKLSVSGACGRRSERLKIFQSLSAWISWGKLSWYFWGRFLFFLILVFYLFSFSFLRLQNWPKEMVLFSVSSSFNGSGPLTGQSFTVLQLEIGVDFPCDSSVLKASPPLQATAHAPEATWLPVRGIRLPVENDARLLWIFSSKRPETSWNLETSHSLKTHLFWRKSLPNCSRLSP